MFAPPAVADGVAPADDAAGDDAGAGAPVAAPLVAAALCVGVGVGVAAGAAAFPSFRPLDQEDAKADERDDDDDKQQPLPAGREFHGRLRYWGRRRDRDQNGGAGAGVDCVGAGGVDAVRVAVGRRPCLPRRRTASPGRAAWARRASGRWCGQAAAPGRASRRRPRRRLWPSPPNRR